MSATESFQIWLAGEIEGGRIDVKKAAKAAGVSPQAVYRWAKPDSPSPRLSDVEAVANSAGRSVAEIIAGAHSAFPIEECARRLLDRAGVRLKG